MSRSVEDIFLSEMPKSSFSILSRRLDTSNPRRRDWRTVCKKINLDLSELKEVEMCNEHCRKLIEIWSQDRPRVRDLLEILEEMGCAGVIGELQQDLEQQRMKQTVSREESEATQVGGPVSIAHPLMKPDPNSPISPLSPISPISPPPSLSPLNSSLAEKDSLYPAHKEPISVTTIDLSSQPASFSSLKSQSSTENHPLSVVPLSASDKDEPKSKGVTSSPDKVLETRERVQKAIYVSYHEKDTAIGEEIVREMEARNVQVFSTENVLPGESEIIRREELFKLSRSVIAVITPDYYKEEGFHLLEAIFGASGSLRGNKRTLIPVVCRIDADVPNFIISRASVKWEDPKKFSKLFNGIQTLK